MRAVDSSPSVGWFTGFAVASATSGAILLARITEGSARAAVLGDLVSTVAAIVACCVASHLLLRPSVIAWSALGAAVAIVLVHVVARHAAIEWLDERPRQIVNDVAAAVASLGLVFVFASRRPLLPRFVAVTAPVAAYALTFRLWHCDHSPNGFLMTVQQWVVAQFVSVALALLVFRTLRTRPR